MQYQHISIDASIGPIGAEVGGVDLSNELASDVVEEIRLAWLNSWFFGVSRSAFESRSPGKFCRPFWRVGCLSFYEGGR